MGTIQETGSNILGVETRSESAFLRDATPEDEHLFLPYTRATRVRDEIAQMLMNTAGNFYAKNDLKSAEEWKAAADKVRDLKIDDGGRPYSFEATYEWIAEVVYFFRDREEIADFLKAIAEREKAEEATTDAV